MWLLKTMTKHFGKQNDHSAKVKLYFLLLILLIRFLVEKQIKKQGRGGAERVARGLSLNSWSEQHSMHLLCWTLTDDLEMSMNPTMDRRQIERIKWRWENDRSMENRKYDKQNSGPITFFFSLVAFVLLAKHLISRVFRLFQRLLFCDRKQRPKLNDFTSSTPSTHNICSGPATEAMRARTMLSLLNHLICSALSRSVLSDTVAVHQSRHTHTFTRYHTDSDRQKYSPFKCALCCKDLIQ